MIAWHRLCPTSGHGGAEQGCAGRAGGGLGLCSPETREQQGKESRARQDTAGLRRLLHFQPLLPRKSSQRAEQDRAGSRELRFAVAANFGNVPLPRSRLDRLQDRQREAKQRSGISQQQEHHLGERKAGLHLPRRGELSCPVPSR